MIALKFMVYKNRCYKPGDKIEVEEKDCSRLIAKQLIGVPLGAENRMVTPPTNRKRGRPRKEK